MMWDLTQCRLLITPCSTSLNLMAIPHRSIGEWLRNIDADLQVYVAKFEELGYNLKFLLATATRLLQSELETVDS